MKKQFNVKIEKALLDAFRERCHKHSFKMNGKIEEMIKNFMEVKE